MKIENNIDPGMYLMTRNINLGNDALTQIGLGNHSLILYIQDPKKRIPKQIKEHLIDIGNGQKGMLLGGYRKSTGTNSMLDPQLIARINYSTDKGILKSYLKGNTTYNVQFNKLRTTNTEGTVTKLMEAVTNFTNNSKERPITYRAVPIEGTKTYNSNSLAHSLLTVINKEDYLDKIKGNDPGISRIINPVYFQKKENPNDTIAFSKVDKIIKQNYSNRKLRNTLISIVAASGSTFAAKYFFNRKSKLDPMPSLKNALITGGLAGAGAGLLAYGFQNIPLKQTSIYPKLLEKEKNNKIKRKDIYTIIKEEKKKASFKDTLKTGAGASLLGALTVSGVGGPALIGTTALASGVWGGTMGAYVNKKYKDELNKLKETAEFKL